MKNTFLLILIMLGLLVGYTVACGALMYGMVKALSHPRLIVVEGTYVAPQVSTAPAKQTWTGTASYYSESGCVGCREDLLMANGEVFNDEGMTVAFNKLPLGAFVEVTNVSNEQAVVTKVTDRGGFEPLGRIIDLSKGVKEVLNCSDLCEVRVKEL